MELSTPALLLVIVRRGVRIGGKCFVIDGHDSGQILEGLFTCDKAIKPLRGVQRVFGKRGFGREWWGRFVFSKNHIGILTKRTYHTTLLPGGGTFFRRLFADIAHRKVNHLRRRLLTRLAARWIWRDRRFLPG